MIDAFCDVAPRTIYDRLCTTAPTNPSLTAFKGLALNGSVSATRCGHDFFGTDHSLFATDAPFDSSGGRGLIARTIAAIASLDVTPAERALIFEGNARKLFLSAGSGASA